MLNKLHIMLIALLAGLFAGVSMWGTANTISFADQQPVNQSSPISKKEQKNQRRMDKSSRKKKRTPTAVVVLYRDMKPGLFQTEIV